jgi:hypothetical protein
MEVARKATRALLRSMTEPHETFFVALSIGRLPFEPQRGRFFLLLVAGFTLHMRAKLKLS